MNTVDHSLLENALALGRAARDWHWRLPASSETPADDLAQRTLAQPGAGAKSLRIAAMHFPLADGAAPGLALQKVLANRARFAHELQNHHQVRPVAHLMLGGHTHVAFPGVGQLPRDASAARHAPLAGGQCQIVSASLSQQFDPSMFALSATAGWSETRAHHSPYQCTLLRFFSQPGDPDEIIMDRAVAAADNTGVFDFILLAPGSSQSVERMTIRL